MEQPFADLAPELEHLRINLSNVPLHISLSMLWECLSFGGWERELCAKVVDVHLPRGLSEDLNDSNDHEPGLTAFVSDLDSCLAHKAKDYEDATGFQWPISDIILRGLPERSAVQYCLPSYEERGYKVTILKRNWDDMVAHRRRGF